MTTNFEKVSTSYLTQNSTWCEMRLITPLEIIILEELPCPVYISSRGIFSKVLEKKQLVSVDLIKNYLKESDGKFYTNQEGYESLIENVQDALRTHSRKLSVGKAHENARKLLELLTIHLKYLYLDPTDDIRLNLQYQCIRGFAHFLMNNPELHSRLLKDVTSKKFSYIHTQPFISSLFLLGVLKIAKIYSDKEIENMFIASYFKDIGMSLLPLEISEKIDLRARDKNMLKNHPKYSVQIIATRIPLNATGLRIIEGHHSFSILGQEVSNIKNSSDSIITGSETILVNVTDIIAAMISERPYRSSTTIFKALELVKGIMVEQFPQEFRLLVSYFKNFFVN